MSEYQFTKDWFHWAPAVWEQLTPMLPHGTVRRFLEIGSFEGRSMVWIAENMMNPGDILNCIDTWQGGEEHDAEDMAAVESRFDHNREKVMAENDVEISKNKSTSNIALATCIERGETYDFVYIDGSHVAKDVLTDACMAWPLLKPNGIMVFDDYTWGNPRDALHRPKLAIDAFINLFAEEVEVVHLGYQAIVRNKA